jgi:hypothetical protein
MMKSLGFYRAVAFGPAPLPGGMQPRLLSNGRVPASAPVADRVRAAGRLLDAWGERLQVGDRITGSVVQVPVSAGDPVTADMSPLGKMRVGGLR